MTRASERMPVLFVGHGSPMNVIEENRWSRGFAALADLVPSPSAILAVSAHWYGDGVRLTASPRPPTVHDFSGFPRALYEVAYPAPGSPELARRVRDLLGADRAILDPRRGLDHGTWSVLHWMRPEADVPVIQLSLDRRLDPRGHHDLGRRLAPLRDEGVLILGSGNMVHNLGDAVSRMRDGARDAPAWARRFDESAREALARHDTDRLVSLWPDSADARAAHPTPEHWLPLLYAHAAADAGDAVRFPIEGFDWGSLSMTSVAFG